MLNKVILQGRLGSDPELRATPSGVEVASVNIAVDRDRKDANGERLTDWVTIVAWRNAAKFLSTYFQKGRVAIVEGRLQMRNYTDRDGNKRVAAEVVVDNVYFGDSRPKNEGNGDVPDYGGNPGSDDGFGVPPGFTPNFGDDEGKLPM